MPTTGNYYNRQTFDYRQRFANKTPDWRSWEHSVIAANVIVVDVLTVIVAARFGLLFYVWMLPRLLPPVDEIRGRPCGGVEVN